MTNASGKQTYDIFISYRTTHADWVETLAHNLKAQDYSIFLDRWVLIPGQHFPGAIYQALKNSHCAILVASPDASDSGWVQQELQLMITLQNSGSGFFYVPIVIGEFPDLPFLETVQAVDFGDSSPQDFLDDLRAIPQARIPVSLLISPSSDYQRQLYDKTKDRTNKWVAPSRSELTNLLLSPTPEITLANLLARQLTLTQLSPYQLGGGVNREAIFFGRQEIIAHIMNRDVEVDSWRLSQIKSTSPAESRD